MEKKMKRMKSWWLLPLLLLVCLFGGSSPTRAATWHFANNSHHVVENQPTLAKPYMHFVCMYFDKTEDAIKNYHGFFTTTGKPSGAPSSAPNGPAIFINGNYVYSPIEELCAGDNRAGTAWDACGNDSWWKDQVVKTVDGITYTIRFYNPYHDGDSKRCMVNVLIFPDKIQVGQTFTVKIAGLWKIMWKQDPTEESYTWTFTAANSLGIGVPSTSVSSYGSMNISGTLNRSYGPTIIGSKENATNSGWLAPGNMESPKTYPAGTTQYSNQSINFSERTDYYNPAAKYVESIIQYQDYTPSGFKEMSPKVNINYYQWFKVTAPGYVHPKSNPTVSIYDKWKRQINLSWETEVKDAANCNKSSGNWVIYQTKKGTSNKQKLFSLHADSLSKIITIPTYDEDYVYDVYFVPFNSGNALESELSKSVTYNLNRGWEIKIDTLEVYDQSKIRLHWAHNAFEDAETKNYSLVLQRSENNNIWTDIKTINITSSTTNSGEYIDGADLVANRIYYYRIKTVVLEKEIASPSKWIKLGGSKILNFTATRGTYSSMVKLRWEVKQVGTNTTNFTLRRRQLGSDKENDWMDIYSTSGTASGYSYDDVSAQPGSYNEYKVIVWSQDGTVRSDDDEMTTDGFSLSSGIISGNITYGTGIGVDSVKVTLKQQSDDGEITRGMRSLRFSGAGSGLTYKTDTATIHSLFGGNFSIQMYLNPSSREMKNNGGQYYLMDVYMLYSLCLQYDSLNNRYRVGAWYNGYKYSDMYIPADKWTHLTFVHDKAAKTTTLYAFINGNDTVQKTQFLAGSTLNWRSQALLADAIGFMQYYDYDNSGTHNEQCYRGYVDEFRFFTKALTEGEIKRNYNHPLAGNEPGLAIYYPFDEGLLSQTIAYDFSKTNGMSNGRHASSKVAAYSSTDLPSEEQLSLMAFTNNDGAYEIRGVPFSGEGTSYSIIPSLGIHEFSPATRSRFVSMSSLNLNGVDFEDISSFPVSGKVFYKDTDYPVEGVLFRVDGMPCSKDGQQISTNEQGEFTISVPIGEHFISVEKSGHVFVNNGRYPADPNGMGVKRNFNQALSNVDFLDSTLVNFTGRVVGGSIEGDKPIGFGLSKNNIGVAEVVLTPQNPLPRMNVDKVLKETTYEYQTCDTTKTIASATPDIKSTSWRGAGEDKCRMLIIHTDSASGEFSAMVPPLQYKVGEITVVKTGEKLFDETTVDLSQPLLSYKDSTENSDGGYKYYKYHTMMRKTFHSQPSFTVAQAGHTDGAFGESSYEVKDLNGTINVTNLYTKDADGKVNYTYGGAIFVKENPYTFNIEGFEEYKNFDLDEDNPAISRVPLAETVVTIENELSSTNSVYIEGNTDGAAPGTIAKLQSNQLLLDSLGRATYKWKAGFPNIAKPYTRTIAITYEIDNKTYTHLWGNNKALTGIVLGDLPTGNNFVTQGPDLIDMVLRDPPGTKSKAEWTSGTVKSYSHSRGGTWSSDTHIKTKSKLGTEQDTGIGIGVMTIQNLDAKVDLTVGVDVKVEGEDANSWGRTVTATRAISTSDEMEYVGAQGDVYIGSSTNIIYGLARNVDFVRVENSDSVELKLEDVLTTSLGFDTEFAYTQNYIENVLIPNLEKMRDGLLTTVSDTIGFVNEENTPVYLTLLPSSDKKFASSNHDKEVWGNQATAAPSSGGPSYRMYIPDGSTKNYQDIVEWCNNSILNWKQRLSDNEEEKVKANEKAEKDRKDSIKVLNVSFDSGTSVTRTIETENTKGTHYDCNVTSVAVINLEMGCSINKTGVYWDVGTETGGGEHFQDDTETKEVASFSYTLQEEGDDDAISVDIYDYGQYGPIFRTRGGQTSAPYEGEVRTKYYTDEKGEHPVIMEATMQIEVPQITVDVPEVADVPSGGTANYTLRLSNASEIDEDVYYRLLVADETNPDGAILSIDGKVITDNRIIKIPAGQTVTKLLQLKQADMSILDYKGNNEEDHELYHKGIALVLASQSQYDPTSTWDVIADTVFVKAHFVPSSSPVDLALSKTLMNTQTGTDLQLTFSGFDRNYRGLKAFRLQYKKQGSTGWTQIREFVVNKADKTATNDTLPDTGASISYMLPMKNFSDGDYLFRVVSTSSYGLGEVYRYSNEIALTKDTQKPRPLGQPEPADGILDIGDELSVTLSEPFIKGELTKEANFKVTGVLNGATVDHNTALSVGSSTVSATTEAGINLADKDFSIDAWVNITGSGTLLSHGAGTNKLTVGTNDAKQLVVTIGDSIYTSNDPVPTDDWSFLSLCYQKNENGSELSATMANSSNTYHPFSGKPVVAYNGNGPLSVGCGAKAALHELLLWDEAHDMPTALMNRSKTKNPTTRHLIGYWKMNEGEGTTIRDYARSRNMTMSNETWYMNNVNKALELDGTKYLAVVASDMEIFNEDDYAVEFWMRGGQQTGEAQLLQEGQVGLWLDNQGVLQLTNIVTDSLIVKAYKAGEISTDDTKYITYSNDSTIAYVNMATASGSLTDNAWHHTALNVLRQGAVAVYVDGKRVLTTDASNIGSIATDTLLMGVRRTTFASGLDYSRDRLFTGEIDELRVWGATMNADKLAADRKVRLTGKEEGLLTYLPFEKKQLDSGNQVEVVGTLNNLAKNSHGAEMLSLNQQTATASYSDGPAMREKPTETNVSFSYTASDTKVVISLNENAANIEGCTLNFTVRNLRDENGNYSDPAVWSAFINKKEVEWKDGSVSCVANATNAASVTATIVNKSSKQQMWTLEGMPTWLQASTEYGTTNPLEETTVTFTVSESTPIGKYEETVYLTGNNGISTPLTIKVKVKGDEPLWSVNVRDYPESMNAIGNLYVLGQMSEDEDDLVGAFIDNECRGVTRPVYLERFDSYFITMNIYGDGEDVDKPIEFKAYDASTGIIYPVVKAYDANVLQSPTFQTNDLLGRYSSPIKFAATDEVEQNIDLGKGWNWMSLGVKPDDFTVKNVFSKADGKADLVKDFNVYSEFDGDDWLGDLSDMNNSEMYAVQTNDDFTLSVTGHRVKSNEESISVKKDAWTWVAFNSLSLMSLDEALADMDPKDDEIIKGQHGVAYYDSGEWLGNLKQLTPGLGYKIQGKEARSFHYPNKNASAGSRLAAGDFEANGATETTGTAGTTGESTFTPVDYRSYPANMVLIAQTVSDGSAVGNVEVGVFAGEECREAAVSDENGMIYITIPGDEPCELTFRVSDGNSEFVISNLVLRYETDAVIGTPKAPFIINLGEITGISDMVNSEKPATAIFDLLGRKLTPHSKLQTPNSSLLTPNSSLRKGVYIINGQKKVK